MAEVSVTRRIDAPPGDVARHLDPRSIVEMEGTFDVEDVADSEEGWTVVASAPGMTAEFAVRTFDDGDVDGYVYEQVGDRGPFASMQTRVELAAAGSDTDVTMSSTVDLGLPLRVVTDRVAGWKRRGELDRALDRLAAAVEG